ncbi:MAG: glycoside hydrolase family 3 protein [Spirochaetaceae bacterium]
MILSVLSACSTAQNITHTPGEIQGTRQARQSSPEDVEEPIAEPYRVRREAAIDRALKEMPLDAKIAQLIVLEVPPLGGQPDQSVEYLRRYFSVYYSRSDFGGFILFENNLRSLEQLRELSATLAALPEIPAWVMVDEEGGAVSRLANAGIGVSVLPAPRAVGALESQEEVRRLGSLVGRELRSAGITMNLAPVADVSPTGAERSYGPEPSRVADSVTAFAEGLQSEEVAAVAKHFPGIGSVAGDTHLGPVRSAVDLADLRTRDLVPFEAAVAAGIDGIMTSHVIYPEACDDNPAGLSECLVTDILRNRLGFSGVVITDALSMGALASEESVALRAILAGTDLLLMPEDPGATVESLLAAVEAGKLSEARIDESLRRILRLKIDRYVWVPRDPYLEERWERRHTPSDRPGATG